LRVRWFCMSCFRYWRRIVYLSCCWLFRSQGRIVCLGIRSRGSIVRLVYLLGCLDPEEALFVWFICWVFRSQERIDCLGILDIRRWSVLEEILEVWSIHTNSFRCFNSFKCFNTFILLRCHFPPIHLLWPRPVTSQLVLLHLLLARG